MEHQLSASDQHLMGMQFPRVLCGPNRRESNSRGGTSRKPIWPCGVSLRFSPSCASWRSYENGRERLRARTPQTHAGVIALSKIFIPDYRETIALHHGTLEERERESFIILKMIRNRLGESRLS